MSRVYIYKKTFDISLGMGTFTAKESYYDPREDSFEVDELIALPLQILNRKGYLTGCSCAGHPFNPLFFTKTSNSLTWEPFHAETPCESYISFIDHYNFHSLPKGFQIENTAVGVRIFRKHQTESGNWNTLCSIWDAMTELYDWAKSLPELPAK